MRLPAASGLQPRGVRGRWRSAAREARGNAEGAGQQGGSAAPHPGCGRQCIPKLNGSKKFRCHHTASGDGSRERVHVPCLPEASKRGNTKAKKSCFNCLRAPVENTPPGHTPTPAAAPGCLRQELLEVLHFYFVLLPLVFAVSPLARSWPPAGLGCPPGFFPGVSGALAQGRSTQLLSCSEHRTRGTPAFADTLPTPALWRCERSLGALPSAAAAGAPCS